MKKIISLILILATVFAISSCNKTSDVPNGMQLVDNDKKTYKLYVPETWTVDIRDGVSTAYANDKSNISLMTMQWSSSNYNSFEAYCENYYKDLKATFQNVSEIEKYTENQTFGGLPACKYVYTIGPETEEGASAPDVQRYKFMQVFSYDNQGQVYIFTYTAIESKYEDHIKSVNQMIDTFIP